MRLADTWMVPRASSWLEFDDHAFIAAEQDGGARQPLGRQVEMRRHQQAAATLPMQFPRLGGDVERDQNVVAAVRPPVGKNIVLRAQRLPAPRTHASPLLAPAPH